MASGDTEHVTARSRISTVLLQFGIAVSAQSCSSSSASFDGSMACLGSCSSSGQTCVDTFGDSCVCVPELTGLKEWACGSCDHLLAGAPCAHPGSECGPAACYCDSTFHVQFVGPEPCTSGETWFHGSWQCYCVDPERKWACCGMVATTPVAGAPCCEANEAGCICGTDHHWTCGASDAGSAD